MLRILILSLILVLESCVHRTIETIRFIPVPVLNKWAYISDFQQPQIYKKYWNDVEQCTGYSITDSIKSSVKFKSVDADEFSIADISPVVYGVDGKLHPSVFIGYTLVEDNTIYVVKSLSNDATLVRHEMIHYVLWQNGKPWGHPNANPVFEQCHIST